MPKPFDLFDTIQKVDNVLQKFVQLQKCKYCGDKIPQQAIFCPKCGRSQA